MSRRSNKLFLLNILQRPYMLRVRLKRPHPLQLEITIFIEFMGIASSTHLLTLRQLEIRSCQDVGMERFEIVAGEVGFVIHYKQPSQTVAVD